MAVCHNNLDIHIPFPTQHQIFKISLSPHKFEKEKPMELRMEVILRRNIRLGTGFGSFRGKPMICVGLFYGKYYPAPGANE
jgi:hypothetical protein